MESSSRRVVVTGVGLITPLGLSAGTLWESLRQGQSGVGPLQSMPGDIMELRFAAEADQFTGDISCFGELEKDAQRAIRKGLKLMCREIQMGVAAAQRALADANLARPCRDPERVGVSFGSDYMMTQPLEFADCTRQCTVGGVFDYSRWGKEGIGKVDPLWLLKYLPNMPASHIAIYNDLRGPSNSVTMRECSSNIALAEGFEAIVRGASDAMIVGATGTRIHPLRSLHTILQEEIAEGADPARLCRPFDRNRTGLVLAEGSGALVLESLEHAVQRGARPLAEVVGHCSSAVIDGRGVAMLHTAVANVVQGALRRASLGPADVGHVHAHGLGTRRADQLEAQGIRAVFGESQPTPPVTAAKSYLGHMGAGGGAVETIISILALQHGWLPPVRNYQDPDPACNIAVVRPGSEVAPGDCFVNVNFAPMGQASAVLLRRFLA